MEVTAWLRKGWRPWAAGLLAVSLAIVACIVLWGRHHGSPAQGPLSPHWHVGDGFESDSMVLRHKGEIYTVAINEVVNGSRTPVTIDRVILPPQGDAPHLKLVAAFVTRQALARGYVRERGTANTFYSDLRPAKGAEIAPGRKSGTIAFEVTGSPGFTAKTSHQRAVANGVEVAYHDGSHHYVDWWPLQLVLCPQSCAQWERAGHHDDVPAPSPPAN